jgi:DNA processing protein
MLFGAMDDIDFDAPSLSDFKDRLRLILERCPELLPWIGTWARAKDPGCDRLAAAARRHLLLVSESGARYITYADPDYPHLLRCIPDPPLALSVIGGTAALGQPCVSIIGSRKASALAMRESFALALEMARRGFQIVSGGAFGCDLAAHQGALAAEIEPAPTVLVAAGGLARLYPVHNQYVFDQIRSGGGTFISERLWWDGCFPRDFAVRNRIISGMSFATCVMQAAMKSGALLTAKHALEHGRHVLVLRHPEYDVRADGSRWLADDGATVFSSSAELALSLNGPINA